MDNVRTLLLSFVSQWLVKHLPNFKKTVTCGVTVFADYIGLKYLVMFPEGQSVIIVLRCHEININLCLIFGQYFG